MKPNFCKVNNLGFKNPGEGQAQITLFSSTAMAAVSFHTLTNCNSSNSFVLIFMQIDWEVGGYVRLSSINVIVFSLAIFNLQSKILSGSGLSTFFFLYVV